MINKETIDELKKSHSEIFAAKMSVLKDEQVVASVILAQIEQDKLNPPENAAKNTVRSAAAVVITHIERASLAKGELDKVVQSVLAQFPSLDLSDVLNLQLPTAESVPSYQADLKAAQDLLKKIGECGSIKDVRELLKAADPQPAAESK